MSSLVESLSFASIYSYKLVSWFEDQIRKYKRHKNIVNTINELSKLSDSELRDIGINRGEIYELAHKVYVNEKDWI